MKLSFSKIRSSHASQDRFTVLLAASQPDPALLNCLSSSGNLSIKEAFTTQGVLQNLDQVKLVILGDVLPMPGIATEILARTLETSGVAVVSPEAFLEQPEEWLARARLASARQVNVLPSRQINFVNWSGGVGKTTLAMAVCKRFVRRTSLPAALLELSMGGCALHARVSADAPEFFALATQAVPPYRWDGVRLYPMDGRTAEVMWSEEPERVLNVLAEIRKQNTLLVVDAFPGHPVFADLAMAQPGRFNFVVTSPRDDALLQARRLYAELPETKHLVLNMSRTLADRTGVQADVILPFREGWAANLDGHLADPILEMIYPGWNRMAK